MRLHTSSMQFRPGESESVLAISATFTAELIEEALAFWICELGWDDKIRFAPYNQVFQQLLDPSSLLADNRKGINVVLVRLEDWARSGEAGAPDMERLEENVRHFVACLQPAAESFPAPLLVCVCPASPGFVADPERRTLIRRMEDLVEVGLRGLPTAHLIGTTELNELYPVEDVHDPHGDELGHIPYTFSFYTALGTLLARRILAMRMPPYKVIVLDCDETLWRGICGEDGPLGVVVDPPRQALQEFMAVQHDSGMLLCLCSKNNEEDVLETFRLHPEMRLRLGHFVARRVNWEPKSANLRLLAEELKLGLDSFILVDDNPKECAEVEANCPEVLAVPLPPDVREIPEFLKHLWAFDRFQVTEEDRKRTAFYAQQAERTRLEKQASSLEEFIASLNLRIDIAPIAADQLARVSQLTQRTNQMNLTTKRRSEGEIQRLVYEGGATCLTVEVSDRFGSYGLTGVVIFQETGEAIVADTFLLSCRVLGRGVEHRMLSQLGEIASQKGLDRVDLPFVPTQKNVPALRFLESVGSQFKTQTEDGSVFRFPAGCARGTIYEPEGGGVPKAGAREDGRSPGAADRKSVDFVRIASELRLAEQILRRVRARTQERRPAVSTADPPRSELEARLAKIWTDLLGCPVGIHDNFFDLGGHSLLAVQLLSRVRQSFNVDLSLEVVYSGAFTVAELAKAVEVWQIEQSGTEEYGVLLEELEGLSDEEVKALLAEEQEGDARSSPER